MEYGFNDAEIFSNKLHSDLNNWKSSATVQVQAFAMISEIIDGGYKLINHSLITFVIRNIGRLNIDYWSYQNVAMGIQFEESAHGIIMKSDSTCGSVFLIIGREIIVKNIIKISENSPPPGIPPGHFTPGDFKY